MTPVDERAARMALCALQPMGNMELWKLVQDLGAAEVWEMTKAMGHTSRWGRKATLIDPEQLQRATKQCGARFLIPQDAAWPTGLDHMMLTRPQPQGAPPMGVWIRGKADPAELGNAIAIVGSRCPTAYGSHIATDWAADLTVEGNVVVSGMAFGIDAAAHRGALLARGNTVALLACGVDTAYPLAHAGLMAEIIDNGAVISEVPPGTRPIKAAFLARNRMIAAIGTGVLIVEAAARSGARNTATWANQLGRIVMAVPGPVTSEMSTTPNRLIRDSEAVLVSSSSDVLALVQPLQPSREQELSGAQRALDLLPARCREVREAVAPREGIGTAELSARTGLSVMQCLAAVDELVETGWLEQPEPGLWSLPSKGD